MEHNMLKQAAKHIVMPEEMKIRIAQNCKTQLSKEMEAQSMNHPNRTSFIRKPAAVFAAIFICLSLSATALARSGALHGFFRDITDFRGAIVGMSYEQATDEVSLSVTAANGGLTALVRFREPQKNPYHSTEKLGIAAYQIIDAEGNEIMEGNTESVEIHSGEAAIPIPLDGIKAGSYKLVVSAFVSEEKADQPLPITGHWECAFEKN